jgi:ribosomal protein S18 acetylase RimI-like enzyme
MTPELEYCWRGDITDAELVALTESFGGSPEVGWWDRVRPYSLGWVTARLGNGAAAGFVNVAWDGGDHAFLIDTKVRSDLQRNGIGTELVRIAMEQAKRAGCEWLHVDYEDELHPSTSAPATFARLRPRSFTFPTSTDTASLSVWP